MSNADVHFVKGHTHDICEDYGLVNLAQEFVLVADGCSSGNHSDVVARILIHCMKKNLYLYRQWGKFPSYDDLRLATLTAAIEAGTNMGLGGLLSTVLVAFTFENKVYVYVYGDGYVVAQMRNGTRVINSIEYDKNAPNYIYYLTNPQKYHIDNSPTTEKIYTDNELMLTQEHDRYHAYEYVYEISELEFVAIFSDGLSRFRAIKPIPDSKFGKEITDLQAIKHLLEFKSIEGEFVKRRMKRFIKDVKMNGFVVDDDLTCGVMVFNGSSENEGA